MKEEFKTELLRSYSEDVADQIRELAKNLGNPRPLSDSEVKMMLKSDCNYLFVARESKNKKIVGMATLIVYRIPYVKKAWIEDVVTLPEFRKKGIGTKLLEIVVQKAKEEKVSYVDFTSRPSRDSANRLYAKLGFEKRDTNVYRKEL